LAESGDPSAQFSLGIRYATGEDVHQDYDQAAHWFTEAAEQGHVLAQSNLAAYYWAGRGVPKDMDKAYFWAALAQAGGDEPSRVRLSYLASRMDRRHILAAEQQANDWIKQHSARTDSR
jgi:TPR repeat protein